MDTAERADFRALNIRMTGPEMEALEELMIRRRIFQAARLARLALKEMAERDGVKWPSDERSPVGGAME